MTDDNKPPMFGPSGLDQPLASKASQLEDAAYGSLLERADVKEALFRVGSAQAKRDSVSRIRG